MFNEEMKKFFLQVKKPGRPRDRHYDNIDDMMAAAWSLRAEGSEITMLCADSEDAELEDATQFATIENDNGETFWLFNDSFDVGVTGIELTSPEDMVKYLRHNHIVGDLDPDDLDVPHGKARGGTNVMITDDLGYMYTPEQYQEMLMRSETRIS